MKDIYKVVCILLTCSGNIQEIREKSIQVQVQSRFLKKEEISLKITVNPKQFAKSAHR